MPVENLREGPVITQETSFYEVRAMWEGQGLNTIPDPDHPHNGVLLEEYVDAVQTHWFTPLTELRGSLLERAEAIAHSFSTRRGPHLDFIDEAVRRGRALSQSVSERAMRVRMTDDGGMARELSRTHEFRERIMVRASGLDRKRPS